MTEVTAHPGHPSENSIGVSKAILYVADQDRAEEFWTKQIGCEVVTDTPYGGNESTGRWLEVRTPDRSMVLVVIPMAEGQQQPASQDGLPASNLLFTCDDLQRTHQELSARGVEFIVEPTMQPWGLWSMFKDPEGTRFALGERGPGAS